MKKNLIDIANRALILFFSILLIWSLWPLPGKTQIFQPNLSYLDPALIDSCPLIDQLLNANFELEYPGKLWKSQSDQIILRVVPDQVGNLDSTGTSECDMVFDIRLDSNSLVIEPGNRIVSSLTEQSSQEVIFDITPYQADHADGELWINIEVYPADEVEVVRVPLFVIPLDFDVISVLGFPPVLMRYVCLFMLLLQMLIAFRKRLFK